jgi:hypothetical protein
MCIFSELASVSATKIFARSAPADASDRSAVRQFLVYSMSYEASSELAMILPLPTPPAAPEDSLRFLDLSGYKDFFTDLSAPFPEPRSLSFEDPVAARLVVHDVGSFEASFVPHQKDFSRLDPRFRLADEVWSALPHYDDYGFAVFKLKSGAKEVHPMAFEFPRRDGVGLFFPTVHVHDGSVATEAVFHHTLYCQSPSEHAGWESALSRDKQPLLARKHVDIRRALGIILPEQPIQMLKIYGTHENTDIIRVE